VTGKWCKTRTGNDIGKEEELEMERNVFVALWRYPGLFFNLS
jgi:hypothetical protein